MAVSVTRVELQAGGVDIQNNNPSRREEDSRRFSGRSSALPRPKCPSGDGLGDGKCTGREASTTTTLLSSPVHFNTANMVAGKNTTHQLARAASAPKLPPLPKLRIRKPDQTNENPCLGVMSTVLGMWYPICAMALQKKFYATWMAEKDFLLTLNRLLGIFRTHSARMRCS
jgi:hypothetical protein